MFQVLSVLGVQIRADRTNKKFHESCHVGSATYTALRFYAFKAQFQFCFRDYSSDRQFRGSNVFEL